MTDEYEEFVQLGPFPRRATALEGESSVIGGPLDSRTVLHRRVRGERFCVRSGQHEFAHYERISSSLFTFQGWCHRIGNTETHAYDEFTHPGRGTPMCPDAAPRMPSQSTTYRGIRVGEQGYRTDSIPAPERRIGSWTKASLLACAPRGSYYSPDRALVVPEYGVRLSTRQVEGVLMELHGHNRRGFRSFFFGMLWVVLAVVLFGAATEFVPAMERYNDLTLTMVATVLGITAGSLIGRVIIRRQRRKWLTRIVRPELRDELGALI